MNLLYDSTGDGAKFTYFESEFDDLDGIAREQYGAPIEELPIGKAATILRLGVLASIDGESAVDFDQGENFVTAQDDGVEAVLGITTKKLEESLGRAVTKAGYLHVKIVANGDSRTTAEEVRSFEVKSIARKNAEDTIRSIELEDE